MVGLSDHCTGPTLVTNEDHAGLLKVFSMNDTTLFVTLVDMVVHGLATYESERCLLVGY